MCNKSCGSRNSCESNGHEESKTAGYFLHKIEEMLEENFDALHEQIEELEDKISKLEKQLERR